ncbi:hypothetical protein LXL04_006650 [Taraxacum kok-saghyz]
MWSRSDPDPYPPPNRPTSFSTGVLFLHRLSSISLVTSRFFHPLFFTLSLRSSPAPGVQVNNPTSPTRTRCATTVSLSLSSPATLLQRLCIPNLCAPTKSNLSTGELQFRS